MNELASRVRAILARVDAAQRRAGRAPGSVTLVAASKTQPVEAVRAAFECGVRDFGENRVQELELKSAALPAATWHLIGALQRNKARKAVERARLIHSLDSSRLGLALDRLGEERGSPVHVLVEVNLAAESSKAGVPLEGVSALLRALAGCQWLRIDGLMTIPPIDDAAATRARFRTLAQLAAWLVGSAPANAPLTELSMGMSDDFEIAIEEGATLIRVGTALFGPRSTG